VISISPRVTGIPASNPIFSCTVMLGREYRAVDQVAYSFLAISWVKN
jgi:hypothetical protein